MKAFVLKSLRYTKERWPFVLILILAIAVAYLLINKGTLTTSGKIDTIVISDKRCADCDTTYLVSQLKTVFPTISIKELDYSSKEGKDLYEKNKLIVLPAVLFTDAIKNDKNYAQVEKFLIGTGNYLSLNIGSTFNPAKEICDNKIDDTGNGKIDCQDPDCEDSLVCRIEIPKKLDVFVMSQCPYGTKALDAMKEVLENFKGNIDFDIHYIANENPKGSFSSLHGQPEVNEDIRELCTIKYYPEKYMNYIWCRNKNIMNNNWESCAIEAFETADKIKECFNNDEGKKLLSENIKVADQLRISASPTWLANNRVLFSGIDAETVKQNFCKANPDIKGCSSTLSKDTTVTGSC